MISSTLGGGKNKQTIERMPCCFLRPEVFEESLHGVVVGLRQLLDQLFDGQNSMFVVWTLCGTENMRV